MKHQQGHQADSRFCHYFNNKKECPYIELGCTFKHLAAPQCKYGSSCNRKLCQFQHHNSHNESHQMKKGSQCPHCELELSSDDSLECHVKENHLMKCPKCKKMFNCKEDYVQHSKSCH